MHQTYFAWLTSQENNELHLGAGHLVASSQAFGLMQFDWSDIHDDSPDIPGFLRRTLAVH